MRLDSNSRWDFFLLGKHGKKLSFAGFLPSQPSKEKSLVNLGWVWGQESYCCDLWLPSLQHCLCSHQWEASGFDTSLWPGSHREVVVTCVLERQGHWQGCCKQLWFIWPSKYFQFMAVKVNILVLGCWVFERGCFPRWCATQGCYRESCW